MTLLWIIGKQKQLITMNFYYKHMDIIHQIIINRIYHNCYSRRNRNILLSKIIMTRSKNLVENNIGKYYRLWC